MFKIIFLVVRFLCGSSAFAACPELLPQTYFLKLPKHVQQITNTQAAANGPNCLNAVVYWFGLTDELKLIRWKEFSQWIKDPQLFKQISAEDAEWGDVVVFRLGPLDTILHGAIYLDPNSYWQKEGDWKEAEWKITPSKSVLLEYEGLVVEYYRKLPIL